MTELTKRITRETPATVFERSQARNIIVSIEPAGRSEAVIGVRLKGTRQTYRVGVNSVFNLAVQHYVQRIEKLAKRMHKDEKIPIRTARARAKKQIDKELKS